MSDSDLRRLYREQAPRAPEGRFSLEELIEGSGPIELDIGFGRGLSLFERAATSPESRIIGIEVKTKLAYKVNERLQKHDLRKVGVLCGDAREILKELSQEDRLSGSRCTSLTPGGRSGTTSGGSSGRPF